LGKPGAARARAQGNALTHERVNVAIEPLSYTLSSLDELAGDIEDSGVGPIMNAGLLGLLFLGLTSFSIYKSKERSKTVVYTLAAMVLTIGIVLGVARVFPAFDNATVGAATFDVMLLIGALTAVVHSRKSKA